MDRASGLTRAGTWTATLGPVGWWPWGPGTLASAIVTVLWLLLAWPWTWWLALTAAFTLIGLPTTGRAERVLGHDSGRIVIDEAAGMSLTLLAAPPGWRGAAAAFVLFRILDIGKPPPLHAIERMPGGWGVMLDDLAYGAVAAAITAAGFHYL